jgi:hypothetical protein
MKWQITMMKLLETLVLKPKITINKKLIMAQNKAHDYHLLILNQLTILTLARHLPKIHLTC